KTIQIVDRGNGPQLSTSRITVQDLVPYLQRECPPEEIMRWIPALTCEEIAVVERYVQEHHEEVMELDRRIRQRNAQRKNPPEVEAANLVHRFGHLSIGAVAALAMGQGGDAEAEPVDGAVAERDVPAGAVGAAEYADESEPGLVPMREFIGPGVLIEIVAGQG